MGRTQHACLHFLIADISDNLIVEMLRSPPVRRTVSELIEFGRRGCSTSSSWSCTPVVIRQRFDENRFQDYRCFQGSVDFDRVLEREKMSLSLLKSRLHDVMWYFLPRSYPSSVARGYDDFAIGQFVSTVLGTTCGVLSMQSMLFAIGAGSGSLPLAATLNWIIKDGLGQFGGILFASYINNQFDADPKRWRMKASISMDAASFLELLTPLFPGHFLLIASVANVGKNISFLAASASRAAIHKSFAIHENLADITAKTGSQCIIGSLLGTSFGLSIAAYAGGHYESVLLCFSVCSAASLTATYFSMRPVTLTTLSLSRLDAVLDHYVSSEMVLTPSEVMLREKYLSNSVKDLVPLVVGSDIDQVFRNNNELDDICNLFSQEKYMVNAYCDDVHNNAHVHLLFKQDVNKRGMLVGLVHAFLLRRMLAKEGYSDKNVSQKVTSYAKEFKHNSARKVQSWRQVIFPSSIDEERNVDDYNKNNNKDIDTEKMRWRFDLVHESYMQSLATGRADKDNKVESAVESHYVADNNSYANNFVNALMKQTDLFDERTVPSTSNRNTSSCVSSSDNIQKQATSSAANTSSELEDRDKENVWLIDALLLETRVARIEQEHISS